MFYRHQQPKPLAKWAAELEHAGDCAASDARTTGDTVETAWEVEVDSWSNAQQLVDDHTFSRLRAAFERGWNRRIAA